MATSRHLIGCVTTRGIFTGSFLAGNFVFDFVRRNPNYRLPYLCSLVIALAYTTEGRNQELWKVVELFVTRGEQEGITIDRALDTNILVVAILKFSVLSQPEAIEHGRKETFIGVLQEIAMYGIDWRTRWKSIYLTAGIASFSVRLCRLGSKVRSLVGARGGMDEAVYELSGLGNLPYLSLYNTLRTFQLRR